MSQVVPYTYRVVGRSGYYLPIMWLKRIVEAAEGAGVGALESAGCCALGAPTMGAMGAGRAPTPLPWGTE